MKPETVTELIECLELSLENFQQDTLPRPAQIKRIREAIAAGKSELQPPVGHRTIDPQAEAEQRRQDSREEKLAIRKVLSQRSQRPVVGVLKAELVTDSSTFIFGKPKRPVVTTLKAEPVKPFTLPRGYPQNPFQKQERERAAAKRVSR